MKAIITKYHGMTETKPERISATDGNGNRITISKPMEAQTDEQAHRAAADALCDKLKWYGALTAGRFNNDFVFIITTLYPTPEPMRRGEHPKLFIDDYSYIQTTDAGNVEGYEYQSDLWNACDHNEIEYYYTVDNAVHRVITEEKELETI